MITEVLLALIAIEIGALAISTIVLNWQLKQSKEAKKK